MSRIRTVVFAATAFLLVAMAPAGALDEIIAVDQGGTITPIAIQDPGTAGAAFGQDGEQTTTMGEDNPTLLTGVDVLWGGFLGGTYKWDILLYDRETGRFQFRQVGADGKTYVFYEANGTSGWSHVIPGDYDGNGVTDLLFYRATDGLMRFYTISASGAFVAMTPAMFGTTGWTEMVPGDYDGDGSDDLLWYRARDGLMRFYEVDGTLFKPMTAAAYGTRNWGPIPSGDFDGDGSDDLMYYRAADGLYRFYTLAGAGVFTAISSAGYTTVGLDQILTGVWDETAGDDLVLFGNGVITAKTFGSTSLGDITVDAPLAGGNLVTVVDYDPFK